MAPMDHACGKRMGKLTVNRSVKKDRRPAKAKKPLTCPRFRCLNQHSGIHATVTIKLLVTSASLVVTSALLVVTRTLVITRSYYRNKCIANRSKGLISSNKKLLEFVFAIAERLQSDERNTRRTTGRVSWTRKRRKLASLPQTTDPDDLEAVRPMA